MKPKTGSIDNILFDLDGTLTDPREGIVNSILFALKKLGINENNIHELDSFIGPPLRDSFRKRYNLALETAATAVSYYSEYYSVKGIFECKLYPGIAELLESLSSRGYKLFVATSKPTQYAKEVLEHFKIQTYFEEIIGSNFDNTRTDKTEIIAYIILEYGLIPGRTVMIGDTKYDIIGAKNNAIKSIGVNNGYGTQEELLSSHPDFAVNNCHQIGSLFIK